MKMETEANFGREIRALRKARGLSQLQVSRKIGVSPGYMSDVESGRSDLAVGNTEKLASVLGVSALDLHMLALADDVPRAFSLECYGREHMAVGSVLLRRWAYLTDAQLAAIRAIVGQ